MSFVVISLVFEAGQLFQYLSFAFNKIGHICSSGTEADNLKLLKPGEKFV